MNEMPSFDRTALLREPIIRGLMLSVVLHLAVLALVHPMPGSDTAQTLIINARLLPSPPPPDATPTEKVEMPAAPAITPKSPEIPLPSPLAETLAVPKPAPIQQPETAQPIPEPQHTQSTEIVAKAEEPSRPPTQTEPIVEIEKPPAAPPALIIPSPIDTTWYLARQVDRHPKAIGSISPKYPELARQRNQEGSLKLLVKIDDLGQVRDVEVVEAQPPGVFDEAALEAFRRARFQPAMKDGRPVRYQAYMRVEFKLE